MDTEKKKGRQAKNPPEKMHFGVRCTEAEKAAIWKKINGYRVLTGKQITVAEYILMKIGVRNI